MEQKTYQRIGYGSTAVAVVSLFMLAPAVLANAYPSSFFSKVNGNITNYVAVAGLALLAVSLIAFGVSQGKVKIDEQLQSQSDDLKAFKSIINSNIESDAKVKDVFKKDNDKGIVVIQ